ncbi:calcium-binding protein, partial [Rhizobium ruizarguesonis]
MKAGGVDDLIRAHDGHDRIEAGRGHYIVGAITGSDN